MRLAAASVAEIEPLSRAINELADARERDLERARRRAADLAHGLKTPLAALAAQSRRAREAGALEAADGLDRAIAAVSAAVESELSRSRAAAARTRPASGELEPGELLESLIGVVERTDFGARLVFEVDTPPKLHIGLAVDDFMELMGALIENAARFARRRVRIRGADDGRSAVLSVEDDGPGIDIQRRERALIRGARLDEAGPGHGLGLAIVRELVDATGGTLSLDQSELGGLKVEIEWAASAAPSA
jgi:signal transduction histidine kinase